MKFGSHIDYHGSRAYAPDLPPRSSGHWLRRITGPITGWAEQLLSMLLKPGARTAAETVWLVRDDERHFSLLGSDRLEKQRTANKSLWPEGETRFRRPIDIPASGD